MPTPTATQNATQKNTKKSAQKTPQRTTRRRPLHILRWPSAKMPLATFIDAASTEDADAPPAVQHIKAEPRKPVGMQGVAGGRINAMRRLLGGDRWR